jgi:hypothetical protein
MLILLIAGGFDLQVEQGWHVLCLFKSATVAVLITLVRTPMEFINYGVMFVLQRLK